MLDPEADLGGLPLMLEPDKDEPVIPKPGEPRALDSGADPENVGCRDEEPPALTLTDLNTIIPDEPLGRQQVIRFRVLRMAAHVDTGHDTADRLIRWRLLLLLP